MIYYLDDMKDYDTWEHHATMATPHIPDSWAWDSLGHEIAKKLWSSLQGKPGKRGDFLVSVYREKHSLHTMLGANEFACHWHVQGVKAEPLYVHYVIEDSVREAIDYLWCLVRARIRQYVHRALVAVCLDTLGAVW